MSLDRNMTADEIIAILRANPAAALEAVERAKIAGPRCFDYVAHPTWTFTGRPALHGIAMVGRTVMPRSNLHRRYDDPPDAEKISRQDQKLIDDGWVLL